MTLMLTKDWVKRSIENLPDTFSLDELIDRVILMEKIQAADEQIEKGEFLTEGEVDNEIASWFK